MRALRVLLAVLVVLGILFVAADRLAVHLAEDEAASRIKGAQGMPDTKDVDVDIKGFPFLTQVLGRDLDQVDATFSGMRTETAGRELTVSRIEAQLRNVEIGGNFDSAIAKDATGTALISYDALSKATDENVEVGWGGKDDQGRGQVKVTASVSLLGQTFERSVHSAVSVSGDQVKLKARDIPGADIPGVEDLIRDRIDIARKIAGLPKGLELDEVEATEKGIELSVKGSDVSLTG
ncbi:DUF2993 domain-containing protein [Streptomyces sp. HNM0574]|uniref:LmeA family phospholipid-binding protein n=1 Tax=Streptomyces sp. HNM0574 TaxID=2714954 RepID=UPI00146F1796|nr:DUF2993 domain-containing protein [Streptomyces sp. HNM0574]NLU68017.1 DUF2993 domain-containing protein [Streptomyces sp. HNM0574]